MAASSISVNPLGYTGINFTQNPPLIQALRAPTVNDIYTIGTEWADQSQSPPVIYTTTGNGLWNAGANTYATYCSISDRRPNEYGYIPNVSTSSQNYFRLRQCSCHCRSTYCTNRGYRYYQPGHRCASSRRNGYRSRCDSLGSATFQLSSGVCCTPCNWRYNSRSWGFHYTIRKFNSNSHWLIYSERKCDDRNGCYSS